MKEKESDFVVLKRATAYGSTPQAQAGKTRESGLVTVFTGNGKGKTGAAFNMAQRALARMMRVGVVQFCGGSPHSAEYKALASQPLCDFQIFGAECTWDSKLRAVDIATVSFAWVQAKNMLCDPTFDMVLLDEIHLLLQHRYLQLDHLLRALRLRPKPMHVVLTGRHAPLELIDFADLVTEMREVKHPHSIATPMLPQAGVEF
ncbi:MAG: cob(I)yrinic acid a,c-diamide adenosyltransferase [Pseudomonadota bacterium]|jgi:cob(I)alamin adenosyltransferase